MPNTAYLVLKDFKSVLPGKCLGSGIFSFEAIPDTLQVYAVVFDRTNDAYGLALSKVDMKSDTCHLNLKNTPLTEIRQALKIFEN